MSHASGFRKALILILKLAVSAALLWLVLRGTDLSLLWQRLQTMQVGWLLLALGTYAAMMLIGVWRWHTLLGAQHVYVGRLRLVESMWVSLFFNNFLPSNIGGDVIRVADTARAAGSKTLAATIVLVDRGLGLVALLVVAALGSAAALIGGIAVPGAQWLWAIGAVGLLVSFPAFVAPSVVGRLLVPLRALEHPWLDERARRFEHAFMRFREQPSALVLAFVGALLVQGGIVVFYTLTARGLAIPVPMMLAAVLVPVSLVVQMAPVSIGGFGVREAVFTYFFIRVGLPADAAVALSFVGAGLIAIQSLAGGVIFLTRRGHQPSGSA